uniref:Small EDRK-rich factor-like N-terminal domain-containing protein n=1 Tax=Ditylenchus dipsaci TaxID=166011 RepID=A0A915E6X4_9BILA
MFKKRKAKGGKSVKKRENRKQGFHELQRRANNEQKKKIEQELLRECRNQNKSKKTNNHSASRPTKPVLCPALDRFKPKKQINK